MLWKKKIQVNVYVQCIYSFSVHSALLINLDHTTAYILQLITATFQPRGKAKSSLPYVFEVRFVKYIHQSFSSNTALTLAKSMPLLHGTTRHCLFCWCMFLFMLCHTGRNVSPKYADMAQYQRWTICVGYVGSMKLSSVTFIVCIIYMILFIIRKWHSPGMM